MRTYRSRSRKSQGMASSDNSSIEEQRPTPSSSTKRAFEGIEVNTSTKRVRTTQSSLKSKSAGKLKQKSLTQLHFCIDRSTLRRCPLCDLCYTKGAVEDVALHKSHCSRAQKGMEWSKDEDREGYGTTITEVKSRVKLNNGDLGRIISFPADVGGRIGIKLSAFMRTVNLCLSSPPLSKAALQTSKAYLFLLPQESPSKPERIVGCVIAQRIEHAMDVISRRADNVDETGGPSKPVDVAGIFCSPQPQPTPMGVSRMFVSSTHRRQGIVKNLLSAAAETFIPGCPLDPLKSQIAFSQPTGDGNKVMQNWGGGRIRIMQQ